MNNFLNHDKVMNQSKPSLSQVIKISIFFPGSIIYFSLNKAFHSYLSFIYLIYGSLYIFVLLIFRFNFYSRLQSVIIEMGIERNTTLAENIFPIAIIFGLAQIAAGFLMYVKREKIGYLSYLSLVIHLVSLFALGIIFIDSLRSFQLLLPSKDLLYTLFSSNP